VANVAPDVEGVRVRADLAQLPRYRAGSKATAVVGFTPLTLASNEHAFGPLPGVLAAGQEALARMHRYPDFGARDLLEALAGSTGLSVESICVGTGSVALLQHAVQLVCENTADEVVFAWRSFEAYPIVTRIAGATPVAVPLTADHRHDIDAMLAAVTPQTRAFLLCSPNNPTGTTVAGSDIARVLTTVDPSVLVVLDEAYIEFVDAADRPDVPTLLAAHPNLLVLRTFSKAYGLAGLRVGYAMSHPGLSDVLRAVATPFGVSAPAQAAATASLAPPATPLLTARVASVVQQRSTWTAALVERGLAVIEGQANFVWLPLGSDADAIGQALARHAISARVFPGEGVRLTVTDSAALGRVLDALSASNG
jgi:histidinol-phosphate aminotransferase